MAAPKEGGFKISLGGLKAKAGLKASPAQKNAKRPRLALGDDEPDDSNKQQEILGWDAAEGGALDANGKKEKEGPRIIPALPNRDWRAEARRKQLAKAPHRQAQNGDVKEPMEEPKIQYGLTIIKKDTTQENRAAEDTALKPMEVEKDDLTEEQRLEKKALDALLNGKATDDDLVIPVQTEEEAFLNDLHNAPDAPTLEAYEATPIEGFGAALLRGMGWKDGETIGKNGAAAKPKEVKRRPALLGIGAKEEAAVGIELGEWGGKGKGKKVAQSYNPVTLRNKHTGEMITEEELKAKLESQDLVRDEKPEKERRKYDDDDDEEEDERRREKRREKRDDRDGARDRRRDDDFDSERRRAKDPKADRRRDRDDYYDSDRRRDKRRDRDDDYDSERRKDKRRDRERDDDYDGERRRDKRKDRSRSPDDRKEKRRDRYRSRSRDSKRERDRRDRSRDSDDRRKRRRDKEYEYDDDRDDRKRRHKDEKYYK